MLFRSLVNSTNLNWAVPTTGSIDLTGYTSLSGYNSKRGTTFVTLYLEWPSTYTPGDNASAGTFNELRDGTTTYYDNISIAWSSGQNEWVITGPQSSLSLSGTFSTYKSRWITFGFSSAETSSVFTNWTGGTVGSGMTAIIVCAYDTETGELLGKSDTATTGTILPNIGSLSNPLPTNGSSNSIYIGGFGGTQTGTYSYNYRFTTVWGAFGTMFDPLQQTNKTFLTLQPSATIDSAVAWYSIANSNYTTYSTKNYTLRGDYDLYSETNNLIVRQNGYDSSDWTSAYSNTIFPKDSS